MLTEGAAFLHLPLELKHRHQWCLAGPDKAPYLIGPSGLYHASPVSGDYLDFTTATEHAAYHQCGIGYILQADDPYTCIDMDIKDIESKYKDGTGYPKELWTSRQALNFYSGVIQFAQSYAEISGSGKGVHIWVKGDIGAGRRGKGIEVYSRQRFIVCTGVPVSELQYDILNGVVIPKVIQNVPLPINNGDLILQNLTSELGLAENKQIELIEVDADLSDTDIWRQAATAGNSEKFVELCKGNWKQYNFESQSEADLALMSIFTFYTKSNAQCRRLFRQTILGIRKKAIMNDTYLDRTLQLIRTRQGKEKDLQDHGATIATALMNNIAPPPRTQPIQLEGINPIVSDYIQHAVDHTMHTASEPVTIDYTPPQAEGLEWPPGLVGAIAGFIYQSAPRPVKEVAIVAALGLMAGITGKAYNVGQTGLNLYVILIARSAIGKEAMHSGIGHILRSSCGHVISQFVKFTDYASGPALTKAVGEGFGSFVNVSGEWGRKLQRIAEDRRDGPMQQLRTVMTHLYQKSGNASVVGGLGYSNKEHNVDSVNAVAYSMIGETTPGTFYDSLTQTMMDDGFLSRFNIIEYMGERPPENKNQIMQVPQQISDTLKQIAIHCTELIGSPSNIAIQVQHSEVSEKMLSDFNDECDDKIRQAGTDESIRQIWNRAHLKAVRVAGVLAASDNHASPLISEVHANWAILLIKKDAAAMLSKIEGGDIGIDDTSRFRKLQGVFEDYLKGKVPPSYKLDARMIGDGIVPRKYLQGRTGQVRCFLNYRMGATLALDHTLKTSIDSGYIMEVSRDKVVELYGYHGRCFRVLDLAIN